MEEHQARKQLPPHYQISSNLARQPYPLPDEDDEPLEEDINVVPMPKIRTTPPALDRIAEDPLSGRSSNKRKSTGAGKGRSAPAKAKSAKPYRPPQSAKQPFADELEHLEELAERINHVLAERTRKKAYLEQTQPRQAQFMSPQMGYAQPEYEQPALEQEDTESLKRQAKRIRQRLSYLEALMEAGDEPDAPPDLQAAYRDRGYAQPSYPQPSYPQPPQPAPQPPSPQPQSLIDPRYGQPIQPPQQNPYDPNWQRYEYETWRANQELQQLMQQDQWAQPTASQPYVQPPVVERTARSRTGRSPVVESIVRRVFGRFQHLPFSNFLELPAKPTDRLSDAVMWVAVAAIARIASRYLISAIPLLSPIFTLLMLAPAILALFLAVFAPKTGWVPFYRLFLLMLGLFIGGKFF